MMISKNNIICIFVLGRLLGGHRTIHLSSAIINELMHTILYNMHLYYYRIIRALLCSSKFRKKKKILMHKTSVEEIKTGVTLR